MFGKVNEDSFRSIFEGSLFAKDAPSAAPTSLFAADFGSNSSNNGRRRMPFQQLQQQQQQQSHGCIGDARKQQPSQLFPDNSLSLDLASLGRNSNSKSSPASSSNSSSSNSKVNPNRYKTELCRPFQENGVCKYGEKCQFAHGNAELRTVSRHPKYKTDLCRTYHSVGFCPYGPRCHFIHNLEEVKPKDNKVSSPALQGIVMPQLPLFGAAAAAGLTQEQLSSDVVARRLRNPSESGYTSSGSSSSSSSSFGGDSDAGSFSPAAAAGSRLPVFSTLSK